MQRARLRCLGLLAESREPVGLLGGTAYPRAIARYL